MVDFKWNAMFFILKKLPKILGHAKRCAEFFQASTTYLFFFLKGMNCTFDGRARFS